MANFPYFLLLAAFSSSITANPVPKNDRRQLYANSSSSLPSTLDNNQRPSQSVDLLAAIPTTINQIPTSFAPSLTSSRDVKADTAIVIEPLQPTVITHVIPAITFQNPKGEPIASQPAETILSTSFFTPTPSPQKEQSLSPVSTPTASSGPLSSPKASSIVPTLSSSLVSSSISFTSSGTQQLAQTQTGALSSPKAAITSSLATSRLAVESLLVSASTRSIPQFSYSPDRDQSSVELVASSPATQSTFPVQSTLSSKVSATLSSVVPMSSAVPASSIKPSPSVGALPGFNHPGSASRGPATSGNSTIPTQNQSSLTALPSVFTSYPIISQSQKASSLVASAPASVSLPTSRVLPPAVSGSAEYSTKSRIIVTKTLYTTVAPSSSNSVAPSSAAQALLSSAAPYLESSAAVPSPSAPSSYARSSAAAALPPTSLVPPPVVIVTLYSTVTPATPNVPTPIPSSLTTPQPALSSTAPLPPSFAAPLPSSVPAPVASSYAVPVPPASSSAASLLPIPTSQAPAASSTPPAPPAPSQATTSEGPLIISPIAPSQIFTVTITQKETVTATATTTISVTVRT